MQLRYKVGYKLLPARCRKGSGISLGLVAKCLNRSHIMMLLNPIPLLPRSQKNEAVEHPQEERV